MYAITAHLQGEIMDLKIKDVADLLNVSETTIRRWLTDGKIPAYRINQQYRFNRNEIENWVMRHKLTQPEELIKELEAKNLENSAKRGSKQFSLYRALHKGDVFGDIQENTKEGVIQHVVKSMASSLNWDCEVISELLMERESLQPTALNHGVAIPHTRDFLLNAHFDVVTIAYPAHPIPYGALDGQPVHTLFFLFANHDKNHLHLLAKIAHFCSNPANLEFLQKKPTKEQLLEHVKNWESLLNSNAD